MKRTLTAEQAAARDERRGRMRAIAKQISAMSEEQRQALAARCPVATIEGRTLSLHNQCMVATQLPSATVVGGFRQWITAGRAVRKGEHGLAIWVPIGKKTGENQPVDNHLSTSEAERPGFILGTVFDISQTQEIETQQAA